MINHLKQWAKKRDIEFSIQEQDLLDLREKQEGKCWYSWLPMTFWFVWYTQWSWTQKTKYQISCDRKDNNQGYTESNIVLCCTIVNSMKGSMSETEFREICETITKQ